MSVKKDSIDHDHMDNILEQTEVLKNYLKKEENGSIDQLVIFMDTLKEAFISITIGDLQKAAEYMKKLTVIASSELFRGIGGITRELHESIKEIKNFLEPILTNISEQDIQGLSTKLTHVSSLVKDASERTLDLLFSRQEIAISDNVLYDRIARLIVSDDKKGALLKLKELKTHNAELVNELMRLSELQIHADLVDQIIKKVSRVVENMEIRLVDLVRRYGQRSGLNDIDNLWGDGSMLLGPAIPGDDKNIAASQDDVDSLLKSLGL